MAQHHDAPIRAFSFAGIRNLVVTGPTNTNLLDLYLLLVG